MNSSGMDISYRVHSTSIPLLMLLLCGQALAQLDDFSGPDIEGKRDYCDTMAVDADSQDALQGVWGGTSLSGGVERRFVLSLVGGAYEMLVFRYVELDGTSVKVETQTGGSRGSMSAGTDNGSLAFCCRMILKYSFDWNSGSGAWVGTREVWSGTYELDGNTLMLSNALLGDLMLTRSADDPTTAVVGEESSAGIEGEELSEAHEGEEFFLGTEGEEEASSVKKPPLGCGPAAAMDGSTWTDMTVVILLAALIPRTRCVR